MLHKWSTIYNEEAVTPKKDIKKRNDQYHVKEKTIVFISLADYLKLNRSRETTCTILIAGTKFSNT